MPTRRDPRGECRPNDEPTLHERIIRALIVADPRMCRNGFWQAVRGVLNDEGLEDEDLAAPVFQPDAYLVDATLKHINIFEVEVSHSLTEPKKADYAWFWFIWDCQPVDWEPRLFVVDRYGHGNELDLRGMYLATVNHAAAARFTAPKPYQEEASNG